MPTASQLLTDVRRAAAAPTSTSAGTADSDILAMADAETRSYLVPLLVSVREEYLICERRDSIVANKAQYAVPQRAVGAKLRDVFLLVSGTMYPLRKLEPEEVIYMQQISAGTPSAYYMEGARVVLVPTPPTAQGKLVQRYICAPGQLTTSTGYSVSAVTIDSPVAGQVTLTLDGQTVANSHLYSNQEPYGTLCPDLIYVNDDGGFNHYFEYYGDPDAIKYEASHLYLSSAHYAYYVQLPTELYPLLVQRTAVRLLESVGNGERAAQLSARAADIEHKAMAMLTPRVDGENTKVMGHILWPKRRYAWL